MFQYFQGVFTKQGHKGIPEGHFEEEQGRKGFFGQVSHLIRKKPSTRWVNIEGPLKPHLYDIVEMAKSFETWQRMLFNSDVALYNFWTSPKTQDTSRAFKNADGDTVYFCHQGRGVVLSEYGLLDFKAGSYIVMPKALPHNFVVSEETQFLVIESMTGAFREPDRGMVGRNAFYDTAAIGKPSIELRDQFLNDNKIAVTKIDIKRQNQMTRYTYEECYYDVVGWKGDLFPFTLHVDDLMPMLSHRVHLPPSAHTTFVANGFVICTFAPRPLESDKDALKVPFYHQNIDYDEVLFYHNGNFFSRDNLHAGMMSFHPAGFAHGPHPKAMKTVDQKTFTDEYAVMVDTWSPLEIDEQMTKIELKDYWKSWMK